MSKKHFIAIAKRFHTINDLAARRTAAEAFADIAAQVNHHFDRPKFMTACGL